MTEPKHPNVLILTSGGDAPGMNAAIRSIVRTACYHGLRVFACYHGYQGLLDQQLFPLQPHDVANRIQWGGTFLKSNRCLAFHDAAVRAQCRQFLAAQHIDYVIVIGGNGSLCGAAQLAEKLAPVLSVSPPA